MKFNEEKLAELLMSGIKWATMQNQQAEARHDDMDGQYYQDYGQYELMRETEEYIRNAREAIDELLP